MIVRSTPLRCLTRSTQSFVDHHGADVVAESDRMVAPSIPSVRVWIASPLLAGVDSNVSIHCSDAGRFGRVRGYDGWPLSAPEMPSVRLRAREERQRRSPPRSGHAPLPQSWRRHCARCGPPGRSSASRARRSAQRGSSGSPSKRRLPKSFRSRLQDTSCGWGNVSRAARCR